MSIDLSQFHQVFFEESQEGLQIMETGLLELDCEDPDIETINAIFRAAHSIKGSSGTFGFTEITEFTHVLETLLDEVREGKRGLTQEIVDLLLKSVDCLGGMLAAFQNSEPVDPEYANELTVQFNAYLKEGCTKAADQQQKPDKPPVGATKMMTTWNIRFVPSADILKTGNEPVRMIRELAAFGDCCVTTNLEKLPDIGALEPDCCYLSWDIELTTDIERAQIEEIFEWVIDESDLSISESAGLFMDSEPEAPTEPEPAKEIVAAAGGNKPAAKPAAKSKAAGDSVKSAEATSIRVSIEKIDGLVNLVGELVITQAMLSQVGTESDSGNLIKLQEGLAQLEHNTRELQESVMRIRMLPISFTFSRFPRLVRDLSRQLNKKVEIKLVGEQTELDKTVMEKIGDPLVHLVRNALDHGLESPEERIEAGKPETGTIELSAFHQGGNIVIEIRDDGRGLNTEKIRSKALKNGLISETDTLTPEQVQDLIFQPGFSTAEAVTDVSGRGVGMDVVRRNIQELSGSIEVESNEGFGSTFAIRLPLTLAILDGQLVQVGGQTYILPLVSIVESIQPNMDLISHVAGGCDVLRLRDEYIPIIKLNELFCIETQRTNLVDCLFVVVEVGNLKVALVVDDLLGQQQVVIKSMETNYKKVDGVSGATILGDGTVSLILEIMDLIKMAGVMQQSKNGLHMVSSRGYAA